MSQHLRRFYELVYVPTRYVTDERDVVKEAVLACPRKRGSVFLISSPDEHKPGSGHGCPDDRERGATGSAHS